MDNSDTFQFPQDLQPIPGTLRGENYTDYIEALSSFLRRGPRRYILTDTSTIAESSIGHNITLVRLRRLLDLHDILPEEAFYVFALLAGGNYFDLLLAWDESFPRYYETRRNETNWGETCGASFFFIIISAIFGAVYNHFF
jgi:hypothetical protein